MWLGLVALELVLSPKFQEREAMLPSLSLEPSVKLALRPLVAKLKFAVGGLLAGAVPVKFCPLTLAPLTLTLRLAGEKV